MGAEPGPDDGPDRHDVERSLATERRLGTPTPGRHGGDTRARTGSDRRVDPPRRHRRHGHRSHRTSSGPGDRRAPIVYGDTLWDILKGHYGRVDGHLVDFVADYNGIADPSNIPIGTDVLLSPLPAELDSTVESQAADTAAAGSEAVAQPADPSIPVWNVVQGNTLWDIIEQRYGRVDAVMVRTIADYNGLAVPNVIVVGTAILLPPLAADGTLEASIAATPAEPAAPIAPTPTGAETPTATEVAPAPPDVAPPPVW